MTDTSVRTEPRCSIGTHSTADIAGFLLVALPVLVAFACTVRALAEFAFGGPIYGPGGQPWALGEWVISYADGFVRRGLSGEILLPFAHLFGAAGIPYLVVTLALAVFVALTILVLYARQGRNEAVLMLWLPTSVLFPLWDYNVAGRKEQIALALAAVLALRSRRGAVAGESRGASLAIGLTAALFMFLHEGLVFFLPLVWALLELRRTPTSETAALKRFLAMVGPSAFMFVWIALASRHVDTALLYAAVPGDGPTMKAWCDSRGIGSICWLGFPTRFVVGYVYNIGFEGFLRALAIVIAEFVLVTFVYLRVRGEALDRRAALILAVGWAGVAPLYFIAFDWGRWDAAVTMLFVLLAPVERPRPTRPLVMLLASAALFSLFTVSHLQSQSFEIGGPRLVADGVRAVAAWLAS